MTRSELLLGGILTLMLAAVLVAGLLFWQGARGATPPAASPAVAGRSALGDLSRAQAKADTWAPDASLLTARATWPAGSYQPHGASWGYVFYSPTRQETALISVVDSRAVLLNTRATGRAVQPGNIAAWQVDSTAIIAQLMANGGQGFVKDSQGTAVLSLTLNNVEKPVWKGKLLDSESQQSFSLTVDAATGQPIHE